MTVERIVLVSSIVCMFACLLLTAINVKLTTESLKNLLQSRLKERE